MKSNPDVATMAKTLETADAAAKLMTVKRKGKGDHWHGATYIINSSLLFDARTQLSTLQLAKEKEGVPEAEAGPEGDGYTQEELEDEDLAAEAALVELVS